MKRFCTWLLYKRMGWTTHIDQPCPEKCIICLAPHTSNWDFIIGELYNVASGMKSNFLMKKEWFFWPLGMLFRRLGGIPVYRQKHTSMTDTLASDIGKRDHFRLCITPEGTRKRVTEWKRGFYIIAQKANIPILLYAIDYKRKLIECTRTIMPTGDIDADMKDIKLYYKDYQGRKPELFTI